MDALVYMTYLAVILLAGIVCTLISNKLKIPNILLLILVGMLFGSISNSLGSVVEFPPVFLASISILALVIVVFDSSSSFRFREFNTFSVKAIRLSGIFLFINIVLLSLFTILFFDFPSLFLVFIFAALMSGTDPAAVLSMLGKGKNRVLEFLEIESLVNTPMMVLLPFIILDLMKNFQSGLIMSAFLEQILPFLQQFVAGIGSGILVGIIIIRIMKHAYSHALSPLAIITSALLTYVLAENLRGNGVLAVTSMGLLFGNFYVKQKFQLKEFSSILAKSLVILVFVLLGSIIKIPLTLDFFVKSISLFLIYIVIRYFAIDVAIKKMDYSVKEKIFMALNGQKGIAVAAVAFTLITLNVPDIQIVLNLTLAFVLYSIITSTIVSKMSRFFLVSEEKKNDSNRAGRN
jgi:cell volume regulation protein A